ncbi:response regulator transcription factor [Candidatus Sulfurimonas baltica]|uniref:Response regulator n=1 Tax=Candidatus Sulfurimonas baltica TaxID=2740404 RepID=A0A7S7RMR3_9BACT|nr:response regulator [Candidatus Sulfurimonas baltica]QOY51660.1 response regulator [Candidatus Sulfurimonas baltica]
MNDIKELREHVKDLKVLFVDDEEMVRDGTGIFLRKFFDNVIICCDGEDGLKTFKESQDFDIVITDVVMPKMDGITMIKNIKKINPDIFTIFITASRELEDAQDRLSNITIKKPISFDDIIMIMQTVGTLK